MPKKAVRNRGIELNLNGDIIKTKSLNWYSGLSLSLNRSRVKDVYFNKATRSSYIFNGSSINNYMVGYPVGAMFAYPYGGLDTAGLPLVTDATGNKVRLNSSNDPGLDGLRYMGSSFPTVVTGFSNRIDYKQFYLYFMFDINTGFKARIPRPNINEPRPLQGAENYFVSKGDELKTDVMGFYGDDYNYDYDDVVYNNSDKYVVNAGYILLRDVTLSYRLKNQNLVNKLGIQSLEFKLQGTNLWTRGFNKYNYSVATGSYLYSKLQPTFTFAIFANL